MIRIMTNPTAPTNEILDQVLKRLQTIETTLTQLLDTSKTQSVSQIERIAELDKQRGSFVGTTLRKYVAPLIEMIGDMQKHQVQLLQNTESGNHV